MKERPIIFSAPMVRAILDGTKTQTRRVAKTEIALGREALFAPRGATFLLPEAKEQAAAHCPYGQPGDRLWVRETWCHRWEDESGFQESEFWYRATTPDIVHPDDGEKSPWKPSIHMPRSASRITLEVTGARVERLQDISEADAIAEGIEREAGWWKNYDPSAGWRYWESPIQSYRTLWESINGPGSWDTNPWVWVVEFRSVKGGAA